MKITLSSKQKYTILSISLFIDITQLITIILIIPLWLSIIVSIHYIYKYIYTHIHPPIYINPNTPTLTDRNHSSLFNMFLHHKQTSLPR